MYQLFAVADRIAATVQRLADSKFPLGINQAQGLLKILGALIDGGDRRSAALEQTQAFKGIQSFIQINSLYDFINEVFTM